MLKFIGITLGLVATLYLVVVTSVAAPVLHERYLVKRVGLVTYKIMDQSMRSGGTGFQVQNKYGDTYVVTNKHVCDGEPVKYAQDMYGETRMLGVIRESKKHDLCLLTSWSDKNALKIGKAKRFDKIYIVGYPGLRPLTLEHGMFLKGDELIDLPTKCTDTPTLRELFLGCLKTYTAIYFNAPIYPGNSGSPLVNVYGEVVGVAFAGIGGAPNAAYAVPVEELEEFINDIK